MNVTFDSSLFANRPHRVKGTAQRVNLCFEYGGITHQIPTIYRFRQGLVLDIISIQDADTLRAFWNEWRHREDEAPDGLESPCVQIDCAVRLDDKLCSKGQSSSFAMYQPWAQAELRAVADNEDDDIPGHELQPFLDEYPELVSADSCFSVTRIALFCGSKAAQGFRKISLDIRRTERLEPIGHHFMLNCSGEWQAESFVHPSGNACQLHIRAAEELDMSKLFAGAKFVVRGSSAMARQLDYYVEPPLKEDDRLYVQDASPAAQVVLGSYAHNASSIGIIGGADGPTAIFMAGKHDEDAPRVERIYTKPRDEMPSSVPIEIIGLYTQERPAETVTLLLPQR